MRKNPEEINEPPGTLSLLVRVYNDALNFIAEAFFYLRPDGRIGASGRPDPKRMVVGNELLAVPAMLPKL